MPQSVRPAHRQPIISSLCSTWSRIDMERVAAIDPLPNEVGFRRREPRIAIAHQKATDRGVVHHQKTLKQADAGIFVLDIANVGAIVAQIATQGCGTSAAT